MEKTFQRNETNFHQDAPPRVFGFAKQNRHNPTEAEAILWDAIKGKQLGGHKFRRQHPMGMYILDFYCPAKKLAIELDGGYHDDPNQKLADENRTSELNRVGVREIRFKNEDLTNDYWGVVEGILAALEEGVLEN
jgi:5-methyltetrahydrofolate--homocysteine methyltransferase